MSDTIFKSPLWLSSLDEGSSYGNQYKDQLDILRVSFKNIRNKAAEIAKEIRQSQPGLTLHDITHLDALWETAWVVAGKGIKLNPIEAYVFGCAVLFHDLGMALLLWEEQLDNLKNTSEFKDIVFTTYKSELKRVPSKEQLASAPDHILAGALASRLRELHAFKASELPLKHWKFNGEHFYLIEDSALRQKLGGKIGLIAESHWWSVEEIRSFFGKQLRSPAPTGFPQEWCIDNVKLACLLRLADFIHIDDRRSPTLNYAIEKPSGLSNLHWNFQNKLNRATTLEERLVISSHTNYKLEDNQAWWLAYNTAQEIDKELKSVDNLFIDFKLQRFEAKGIKGVEGPALFAEYVHTEGWEPADTQFKISDFRGIIEKLGGEQLYGDRKTVFLRELIQNAADALEAKQSFAPGYKGEIHISYNEDSNGNPVFEIRDNGIGMSKSALLYGLLDFGTSYWKSSLVRKEHPGLISSGFIPTGEFGIGFFSVFMVAKAIKVITKSVADGSQTLVLEFFEGVSSNPIIRKANKGEERMESGTTVKLVAQDKEILDKMYKEIAELSDQPVDNPLSYICRRLAPALSANLNANFKQEGMESLIVANDWTEIPATAMLNRLSGFAAEQSTGWNYDRLSYISEFVRPIISEGKIIARATIVKRLPSNNDYSGCGIITVGGLNHSKFYRFPGIWLGKNRTASRDKAKPICDLKTLKPWLKEQYELVVSSSKLTESEKLDLSGYFLSLGVKCPALPFAKMGDGWKSYDELKEIRFGDHVLLVPDFRGDLIKFNLESGIIVTSYGINVVGIDQNSFHHEQLWDSEIRGLESPFPVDNLDVNHRSCFGYAILAICDAWNLAAHDVVNASILSISEWKPIITIGYNNFGEAQKAAAMVIINPEKTSKKKIYKMYEKEVKRWIGNTDDDGFSFN